MKKYTLIMISLMTIAGLLLAFGGQASAAAKTSAKDVNKLTAEITMLNAEAKLPQADQVIMKQLKDTFNVGSDKISSLLGRNMQYGDIATVLAFADKMPGGITDANINQVLSMHQQSGAGWGQVAKNVNVDVSSVASTLSSLENDAHKNIKEALAQMPSSGSAAGGMSQPGSSMNEPMGGATGGSSDTGTYGGATGGTGTTGGDMTGGATGGTGTTGGDMTGGATGGTGTTGY